MSTMSCWMSSASRLPCLRLINMCVLFLRVSPVIVICTTMSGSAKPIMWEVRSPVGVNNRWDRSISRSEPQDNQQYTTGESYVATLFSTNMIRFVSTLAGIQDDRGDQDPEDDTA